MYNKMPPKKLYYQVRPSSKIGSKEEKIIPGEKRPVKFREILISSLEKEKEQKKKLDALAEDFMRRAGGGGGEGKIFRTPEQEKFLNFLKEKYKTPSQKMFEQTMKEKEIERQRIAQQEEEMKKAEKEAIDIETLDILKSLPAEIRNLLPAIAISAAGTPASPLISAPGSPTPSGASGVTVGAIDLGRFADSAGIRIDPSEEADFQKGVRLQKRDFFNLEQLKKQLSSGSTPLSNQNVGNVLQALFENRLTTNQNIRLLRKIFRDGKGRDLERQMRLVASKEPQKKPQIERLANWISSSLSADKSFFD